MCYGTCSLVFLWIYTIFVESYQTTIAMKRLFIISILILLCISIYAQETVYLNNMSEFIKNKDEAAEFAIITKNEKGPKYTVDFFSMNNTLLRSVQYSQFGKTPDKRIRHGKTIYRFSRSEQDSLICFYKNNLRTGAAIFYYPDGKKHVDCSYKNGNLNGLLIQYYPNDSIKRKDIYEAGIATASSIYSEEGVFLGNNPFYIPPTPIDSDINTLIRELAREVELPIWKQAGVWEAFVEISFDSDGKLKDIQIIQSNHSGLVVPAIKASSKVFQSKTFEPAIMDNDAVSGSIILPLRYRVEAVKTAK